LNIAAKMIEAEHIGLNYPCAGRHAIEVERSVIVSERYQAAFALRSTNRCTGDRLATRLDRTRLGQSSGFKNKWQADCQKHENLEH